MANIKELSDQLRKLSADQENTDKRIAIAFEILELYCSLKKNKKNTKADRYDCGYAAVILSGLVQSRLGARTRKFLNEHGHHLPDRPIVILRANLMRMEGF